MNILFTPSDNNRRSGAFLSMVALAGLLQREHGHRVLAVLPSEGDGAELLEREGIPYEIVPSYTWTARIEGMNRPDRVAKDAVKAAITKHNATRIARIIRDEGIDLVHVNTTWGCVGALAALQADVPFVWHIREFLEEDQARAIRHREQGYALMVRADRLVAISQSIYDKYEPVFGPQKLVLIPNGIDPARYARPGRTVLSRTRVRLLMVGGGEGKGHRVAIHACRLLVERGFRDFELVMVGRFGKAYREELEALCAGDLDALPTVSPGEDAAAGSPNAPADAHFRFPGPTDDTPAWYGASDILLMCSRAEAFGRVTVEAMMGGCLVVGANSAGTADLIEDGVTGYLFENGDAEALAERIEYVLAHRDEAQAVACAGQAYMLEHMTAAANATHVDALYAEVVWGGPLRARLTLVAPPAPAELRRVA